MVNLVRLRLICILHLFTVIIIILLIGFHWWCDWGCSLALEPTFVGVNNPCVSVGAACFFQVTSDLCISCCKQFLGHINTHRVWLVITCK